MSVGVKEGRALELIIRAAVAEERLLRRRLDRLAPSSGDALGRSRGAAPGALRPAAGR